MACDSMQGLTRSARGTDGPTQQYLCMHVCVHSYFMHPWALSIYLPARYSVKESVFRSDQLRLQVFRTLSDKLCNKLKHLSTHIYTGKDAFFKNTLKHMTTHAHMQIVLPTRKWLHASCSLPGVAVACRELCYVTYGANMVHATANIQTESHHVVWPRPCFGHVSCGFERCWVFSRPLKKTHHNVAGGYQNLVLSTKQKYWIYFNRKSNIFHF